MRDKLQTLHERLTGTVLGAERSSFLLITSLLAGGHVLIQGPPGIYICNECVDVCSTLIRDQKDPKRAIAGNYAPDENEPYMSEAQLDYYRRLLLEWKKLIHNAAQDTLQQLQDGPIREPDLNDRASSETDWGIELRTRDRQRKLISKIDSALRRIEEGEYGYCEVTGEPIGLGRLSARPIATMTVEAQEAHERREKISRDD